MQFRHGPFDILRMGGWNFCPDTLFFLHPLWTRIFFLIYFILENFISKILFFNKTKWWAILFFSRCYQVRLYFSVRIRARIVFSKKFQPLPPPPQKSNGLCLKYQSTIPKLNCKFPAPFNIFFCLASSNGGGVNFSWLNPKCRSPRPSEIGTEIPHYVRNLLAPWHLTLTHIYPLV